MQQSGDSPRPLVGIIVVNWNGYQDTVECLKSLFASSYPNIRVWVVDNGSTDASRTELPRQFPLAEFLMLDTNRGWIGGINEGLGHALAEGVEYVVFANNDIVVAPDAITCMVQTVEDDDSVGIVCPKMYYHDSPDIVWYAGMHVYPYLLATWNPGHNKPDRVGAEEARDADCACGAFLLARTSIPAVQAGLDDLYGPAGYWDDSAFSRSVAKAGFGVVYQPRAVLWHKVSASMNRCGFSRQWFWCVRNGVLFLRQHGTWWEKALAVVGLPLGAVGLTAMYLLRTRDWGVVPAACAGLRQGLSRRIARPHTAPSAPGETGIGG